MLTRVLLMPTLLIIEDAHWIDDASRDLLLSLDARAAPRPWLVCVTRRPQGGDFADPAVDGHVQLALGPIDARAAQSLALAAAGEVAVSDEVLAVLVERAGGNPLFVRELVAASRGASDVSALPDSVETLILTRMDTLRPRTASSSGTHPSSGRASSSNCSPRSSRRSLPDAGNLEHWERLAEFVAWEGAGRLHFLHDLFRAVAYEGLSFRRRREIHGRVGARSRSGPAKRSPISPICSRCTTTAPTST